MEIVQEQPCHRCKKEIDLAKYSFLCPFCAQPPQKLFIRDEIREMKKYSKILNLKINKLERGIITSEMSKKDARRKFLIEISKLCLWWNLQMSLYDEMYTKICKWVMEMNPGESYRVQLEVWILRIVKAY